MSNDEMWATVRAKERAFDKLISPAAKLAEAQIAEATGAAKVWGSHFGATGIDPKHLFVYFVFPTRAEVAKFRESEAWNDIKSSLLEKLRASGYPVDSLQEGWVEVFSEQECKEEANGNWYYFFK